MDTHASPDGSPKLAGLAFGIAVALSAVVLALRLAGGLEWAELRLYDVFVRWNAAPADRAAESAPVTLIRIREAEIEAFGHPLPDALLAQTLRVLTDHSARAIGVDLYRAPVRDDADAAFAELTSIVSGHPEIVFIEKLPAPGKSGVDAPAYVQRPEQIGFSDVPIDSDGTVRRALLFLWDADDRPFLSLPLQLALVYLSGDGITLSADERNPDWVRLAQTPMRPLEANDGGYRDLDAGGYQYLLDFARGRDRFVSYSLSDLLQGSVPDADLAGRIVIVGTTAPSVLDVFRTPANVAQTHGIELHAHATDQLLRIARGAVAPIRFWGEGAEAAWIAVWALAGALLAARSRANGALALGAAIAVAALAGSAWFAFRAGWWIPLAPPALAFAGSGVAVLAEAARRERDARIAVMDLFGRYVSRDVARELWTRRDEFMDGNRPRPQRLALTAMLTDLKGFTSAAEKMDPAALMEWVNEYMDVMTQVVEEHGGFVDDYTGDGLKANFGVPIGRDSRDQIAHDARTAVRCALAMGRALERLIEAWKRRGLPAPRMRIGLYTGEAVVGSLGSAQRMKYTTVGDTVNTAARLESFHKEEFEQEAADPAAPAFRILIGGSTLCHLGDAFETEQLGPHVLRGRGEPVDIYRVHGEREGVKS